MRCKYCKTKKGLINVNLNGEDVVICQDCLTKQENIKELGYTIPLGPENPNANKKIELSFDISKPEYFANADNVTVSYTYEKDILTVEKWQIKAKTDLIGTILNCDFKTVLDLFLNKDEKVCMLWDSLVFSDYEKTIL